MVVVTAIGLMIGLAFMLVGLGFRVQRSTRRQRAELQRELLLADLRMRRLAQAAMLQMMQSARERR